MIVYKRKKVGKYRGGSTHGGGARKKRRGAGSRGGRGRAGSGKRAGHKKAGGEIVIQGKHGFLPRGPKLRTHIINVGDLTSAFIAKNVQEGKVKKEGEVYSLDLRALGYDKLLGRGQTSLRLRVTVAQCSAQAAEKIKAAGGDVPGSSS